MVKNRSGSDESRPARIIKKFIFRKKNFLAAQDRDWTGDLILTKDVLYQLSYLGEQSKRESVNFL